MKDLRAEIERRRLEGLFRERRILEGPQQPEQVIESRRVVAFCSNDYLGLAAHPEVAAAFRRGVDEYGTGAGAAHLVNGHTRAHHALEEELAAFTGRERTLLFSTGYMANLGVVAALAGRGDRIFADRLNHASLVDAARLSGARLMRYVHGDLADLERLAVRADADLPASAETLLLADGVFSMDGDLAPLPALARFAAEHEARLVVDDAHGIGVLGETGRGCCEHFGLDAGDVPILVGTLGKALGTSGAFVAGSNDLIEYLIQTARTYIFTTAMPAAVAEATRASLRLAAAESWRREKLRALVARFQEGAREIGLTLMDSETPIQPVVVGDNERTVTVSQHLLEHGLLVPAIRPPTVPAGTARLRVTLSAAHTEEQVDRLLKALTAD